jgi:hypothetical protein
MFENFRGLTTVTLTQIDATLGCNWRETSTHVVFGAFVGGLALLLILLFAGVPIIGS